MSFWKKLLGMDETAEGTPDKAGDEQTQFAWQVEDEDARHLRDGVEADEAQFSWQVGEDTAPVESEVRETPDYSREAVAEPVVQPAAEPVTEPAPVSVPEPDMDVDDSEFDSDRDAVHLVDGEPVGEVPEEYAAPEDTAEPVVDVEPEPVATPVVEPTEVYESPNTPETTDAPEPFDPVADGALNVEDPSANAPLTAPSTDSPVEPAAVYEAPNTPATTDEPIPFDAHAGADTAVLGAAAATAGAAAGARVGSDQALLYDGLNTLADYEFHPRREVTVEDLETNQLEGIDGFRRRPLTTLLTLVDEVGSPVFNRVFIDAEEFSRIEVADLEEFIADAATGAGTADQIRDVIIMADPGSTTTGSLRLTVDNNVRDLSFDLDPDFGDDLAESDILEAVSPEGFDAYTLLAGTGMKQITVWVPRNSDDRLIEALQDENQEADAV